MDMGSRAIRAHLLLEGGTSIMQNDLSRIDVDVVHGRTLLSIHI